MPEEMFGRYKELINLTAYETFKKSMGEDPRKVFKRDQIQLENQKTRGILTQLPDGSVPSFDEFKSIKDTLNR